MDKKEKFIHGFNLASGGGFTVLNRIWRYFKNWQTAWEKGEAVDFVKAGLTKEMAERITEIKDHINVNEELERLYEKDIFLLGKDHDEYPALLKETPSAPFCLYRKGAALKFISESGVDFIAMVGTRKISEYGEKVAIQIGGKIARHGVIVSGLALGVDAASHWAAVKAGRPTVAVLATGVERITPVSNYGLAMKILETGGTLVSEYPDFCKALMEYSGFDATVSFKNRYLERNRIIAGMSRATIVVEAPEKSGALSTAKWALEFGREVYAVVGEIGKTQSEGCHNLIEKGEGYAILSIKGLLEDLKMDGQEDDGDKIVENLDSRQVAVRQILGRGAASTDEIAAVIKMPVNELNAELTRMEMSGLIKKGASGWRIE